MNNPYKVLKCAKSLVMTSRWEGLPMCALEALSLGVPIISTPTDGLRELIRNDETGYLSSSNRVLANKVVELLTDDQKQKTLSNNCKQKSSVINNRQKYAKAIIAQYESALLK